MKKLLVFSLLLIALAITAGCGGGSTGGDTTPALTYQAPEAGPPIIKPGESVTLRFWGKNTEVVLPDFSGNGYTLFKTGKYDVTFWAQKEDVILKPGAYPLTVSAKDGNDKATATVYVIPNVDIAGRVAGKSFKIKPSKPGEPSEQLFELIALESASAESFGAAGTTYKWELKFDDEDKIIGEFTTSDSADNVLFLASEEATGTGQVCVAMKDGLSGITLPEICTAIQVGKGGIAKPEELAENTPFNGVGLWGDRPQPNDGDYDPSLDAYTIPAGAYVYMYGFGFPDPPADIEGYTKVDITGNDYSGLKTGQWADISLGAYGYMVIFPGEFVQ